MKKFILLLFIGCLALMSFSVSPPITEEDPVKIESVAETVSNDYISIEQAIDLGYLTEEEAELFSCSGNPPNCGVNTEAKCVWCSIGGVWGGPCWQCVPCDPNNGTDNRALNINSPPKQARL